MDEQKPNYYAVIPAEVRYSNIKANAKLLYGEISALANKHGYCWATDSYFAELYGTGKDSIQKWLKQLEDEGFISREVIYEDGTKIIVQRRIYLLLKNTIPIIKNNSSPIIKNNRDNNTSNNNTLVTNVTNNSPTASLPDISTELVYEPLPEFTIKPKKLKNNPRGNPEIQGIVNKRKEFGWSMTPGGVNKERFYAKHLLGLDNYDTLLKVMDAYANYPEKQYITGVSNLGDFYHNYSKIKDKVLPPEPKGGVQF